MRRNMGRRIRLGGRGVDCGYCRGYVVWVCYWRGGEGWVAAVWKGHDGAGELEFG